jgi:DNA-damage-inducible protein D
MAMSTQAPDFDSIKQANAYDVEYWSARDLMPLLGYGKKWQNFESVIKNAMVACEETGNIVQDHFTAASKMVQLGSGAGREVKDYNLSRLACYLIAQNGDPRKPEIAAAQLYFAISTRSNEMHQLRVQQEQRLMLREKVSEGNKSLFEAAALSGVQSPRFGIFEDAGILGQYTLTTAELEEKRQISSGELYNTMPPHELAGNLLRITQTDYNLRTKAIQGEEGAIAEHYSNGKQVREAMIAMSGEKPEDIPPAPSIKKLVEEKRRARRKRLKDRSPSNEPEGTEQGQLF